MVVAAVMGSGAGWLAVGDGGTSSVVVPAHMEAIHDERVRSWNDADGDAAVALFEDGGPLVCSWCGSDGEASGDELVRLVEGPNPWVASSDGWSITDLEILSVANLGGSDDPGDTYDRYVVVSTFTASERPGWRSIMILGDADGEFRIVSHHLAL